ncbi:MAG: hypothetical protein FWG69_03605 [Oscillospiraceae bacterium]|nr:hypothetical protein [Oscillospiraceae bacterium]
MRAFLSFALSFAISFCLTSFGFLAVIRVTILNPSYIKFHVERTSYAQNVADEITNHFISYGMSSGFSAEFMSGIIDGRQIKNDIFCEIDNLYSKENVGATVEGFREITYEKLTEDAKNRGIKITRETEQNLNYLADLCKETYTEYVGFGWLSETSRVLIPAKSIVNSALIISGALTMLLIACIFIIQSNRTRRYRYLIYSAAGSVIVFTAGIITLMVTGFINRIPVGDEGLYKLVVSCANGVLVFISLFAIVIAAAAGIIIALYHRRMKKRLRGTEEDNLSRR